MQNISREIEIAHQHCRSYYFLQRYLQGGNGEASLGRVYVDDPDDHDLADKSFTWRGAPHILFSLDEKKGIIYSSPHIREGR